MEISSDRFCLLCSVFKKTAFEDIPPGFSAGAGLVSNPGKPLKFVRPYVDVKTRMELYFVLLF